MGQADHHGMTLRDYFAGQALSAFNMSFAPMTPEDLASRAYRLADEMLAARAAVKQEKSDG